MLHTLGVSTAIFLALLLIPLVFSPIIGGFPQWTIHDVEQYVGTDKNKMTKGDFIPMVVVQNSEYDRYTLFPFYLQKLYQRAGNKLCIHHWKPEKTPKRIFIYDFAVFHPDGSKEKLISEAMPLTERTFSYDTSKSFWCNYGGFTFSQNKQNFSFILRATVELEDGSFESFSMRRTLLYNTVNKTERQQMTIF